MLGDYAPLVAPLIPLPARLSRRSVKTLEAVARVMLPPGGVPSAGADDVGLARVLAESVATFPRTTRREVRVLLTAIEWFPLVWGARHRFSRLDASSQDSVLRAAYHHKSAFRRLLVTRAKQLIYGAYVSAPEVEEAMGYRYECARTRDGVEPAPQVHH